MPGPFWNVEPCSVGRFVGRLRWLPVLMFLLQGLFLPTPMDNGKGNGNCDNRVYIGVILGL